MMQDSGFPTSVPDKMRGSWRLRLVVGLLILLAIAVVLITNRWLSERFTETTRNRAELRLALYSGNMLSELQRTSVVPLLLSDDPAIRDALLKGSFSGTTLRLIQVQEEIGVASIFLLDKDARTVGATNRNYWAPRTAGRPILLKRCGRKTRFFLQPRANRVAMILPIPAWLNPKAARWG